MKEVIWEAVIEGEVLQLCLQTSNAESFFAELSDFQMSAVILAFFYFTLLAVFI